MRGTRRVAEQSRAMTAHAFQTVNPPIVVRGHVRDHWTDTCSCGYVYGRDTVKARVRDSNAHRKASVLEVVPGARVFTDLAKAAKAVAPEGVHGREGGWIYNANGRPIVQGWAQYGARLCARGVLRRVVNEHGAALGAWVEAASIR